MNEEIHDETETDDEFADHMGDDCKPGELPVVQIEETSLIEDTLRELDELAREREEEDRALQARLTRAATAARTRAAGIVILAQEALKEAEEQAAKLRRQADLLDPPDENNKVIMRGERKHVEQPELVCTRLDPDAILAEEEEILERREREDQERSERKVHAAKELREKADRMLEVARGQLEETQRYIAKMREQADQLDPPGPQPLPPAPDLPPCAGGAPRTVRASRTVAKGARKATQRRAKAAKAPRPQRKPKRAAAGGSGGKAKTTGNGAAKPTEKQVRAHLRYPKDQALTAAGIAKLLRCDAKQVSAVLRPMVASGEVKAEGKTRGRVYWLA